MSLKPKIIFVLPSLASGGAERVLITLANGTDQDLFDPVFINVRSTGPLLDMISPDITYEELKKDSVVASILPLYRLFKRHKPEIVISTLPHMNFAVLVLKPLFKNTKFIVREAITPSYLLDKYGPLGIFIKALYKILFPMADVILSPSRKILDELGVFLKGQQNKFQTLPNPVNVDQYREQSKFDAPDEARKNRVEFIACGRLVRQKGFDLLIESCANLDIPYDWRLDILGDGPEKENLQALIRRHKLSDKISLPGLVDIPYEKFAKADCFLLPSRYEGLPNVVLESLACGTPVIATASSGGIGEIAVHTKGSALKVAADMNAFLKAMMEVSPDPSTHFRPSLLPEIYEEKNILDRFNALLLETAGRV